MRESIKSLLAVLVVFTIIPAIFSPLIDDLGRNRWTVTIICGSISAASIAILVKMQLKKDLAPDFLAAHTRQFFNRDGFCFAIVPTVQNGICFLQIYFQNQFEGVSQARIALQPARDFHEKKDSDRGNRH